MICTKFSGTTVFLALALLSACASQPAKYNWGTYERSLYSYYKAPAQITGLTQSLDAIVNGKTKTAKPVPPGIWAEYGYLLLQEGKAPEAVAAFQQEEAAWPESKAFMDRMIKVASSSPSKSPG
jgi:hypothetical protein